ncbi:MAG: hypothetical protein ACD_28C00346G0004 [uncultured bacterium]|nr:MAG: hypothetical protein ACD_28C00346G0004 [uncultured bacterium]
MSSFQEKMVDLVEETGGKVSDERYIIEPGVMVMSIAGKVSEQAKTLMAKMNINSEQSEAEQLAEFGARLTYLSFPNKPESIEEAETFLNRLKQSNHTSPYRLLGEAQENLASVLVTGSLENMIEIMCHKGRVARLSSSRTNAMSNPLFTLEGPLEQQKLQRRLIEASLHSRRELLIELAHSQGLSLDSSQDILDQQRTIIKAELGLFSPALNPKDREELDDALERLNAQYPATKASFFINSMSLSDWNWTLSKRMIEKGSVEIGLIEILKKVATVLHAVCPEVIQTPEAYLLASKR